MPSKLTVSGLFIWWKSTYRKLFDWAKEVEQRGAGEILFTRWIMTELKWF
jgi:hypothetical protein